MAKTFDVALHIGTLVGVVAYFRKDLVPARRRQRHPAAGAGGRLAWYHLLASAVPAAITGALFNDVIEDWARSG